MQNAHLRHFLPFGDTIAIGKHSELRQQIPHSIPPKTESSPLFGGWSTCPLPICAPSCAGGAGGASGPGHLAGLLPHSEHKQTPTPQPKPPLKKEKELQM